MLILNFKFSKESTFKESFIPISWASKDIFRETDFLEDWYFLDRDEERQKPDWVIEIQIVTLWDASVRIK